MSRTPPNYAEGPQPRKGVKELSPPPSGLTAWGLAAVGTWLILFFFVCLWGFRLLGLGLIARSAAGVWARVKRTIDDWANAPPSAGPAA